MSLASAAQQFNLQQAKNDIFNDPHMDIAEKGRMVTELDQEANKPEETGIGWDNFLRAGVGAGLGYLGGSALGSLVGNKENFRNLGTGLGAILGFKGASVERQHAFRLGFVQALLDQGVVKEAGINTVFPLTTELITAPYRGAVNFGKGIAANTGAIAGEVAGDDKEDVDVTKMNLNAQQLDMQSDDLERQRKQRFIQNLLSKRTQA